MSNTTYNFKFKYNGNKYNLNAVLVWGHLNEIKKNQASDVTDYEEDGFWSIYFDIDGIGFEMQFKYEDCNRTDEFQKMIVWINDIIDDVTTDVKVSIK